jgi:TDG/mug DNA glycosylase family protein
MLRPLLRRERRRRRPDRPHRAAPTAHDPARHGRGAPPPVRGTAGRPGTRGRSGLTLVRRPEGGAPSAIPDVLARNLRVLFCGINPGRVSAAAAAHFANPRNDFWRLLHAARFTRRLLAPHEQWEALDDGVGVTNAAYRTTPGSSDLRRGDFAGSAERLERFARELRPAWIAFVGKEAYRGAFGERADLGVQERALGATRLFVLPSTSPANAAVPWDARLESCRELVLASRPTVRPGVRAILLDRRNRVFLHRFVLPGDPGVWVAPGGARERGEGEEQALRRELREELRLDDVQLGPWVWKRRHVWFWAAPGRIYDSRERFAVVRVPDARAVKPTAHDSLVAGEDAREEHRWWTLDELERTTDEIAPRSIAAVLRELLAEGPPTTPLDVGR